MKCPSCGETIPNKIPSCPKCGRYCGRTFGNQNEEIFMTESKTPFNNVYTQQQQNISSHYTNPEGDRNKNPYDDIISSPQRMESNQNNPAPAAPPTHNPEANPYNTIYHERSSSSIPRQNPYAKERHTTAFVPKNIVEFARHMDARKRSREISYLLFGLSASGFFSLFVDLFIDPNLRNIPFFINPLDYSHRSRSNCKKDLQQTFNIYHSILHGNLYNNYDSTFRYYF